MKRLVRAAFRYAGLELTRIAPQVPDLEESYSRNGRIPWSPGYNEAKERFIRQALADPQVLQLFATQNRLPPRYGVGIDERCIEYPWLLAHLQPDSETLLDAGAALNHAVILEHPAFEKKKLHILTLAPEANCFWKKGVSYLFEDLRNIPIRDAHYDNIVCISTLEHVGCDNTLYTSKPRREEHCSDDFLTAVRELGRVLKPGGSLLLSVPFGVYRYFGTFQQFDGGMLSRARAAFGKTRAWSQVFYRYTAHGWDIASQEECADCQYVEWVAAMSSGTPWPAQLPCEPDFAAAARSVACVTLTKA